jgi:transcriptional regulator with XRE-family HTH domain
LVKSTKGFWDRLQEAFETSKAPEIARRLGLEKQAVYKWRDGSLPALDTLLAISETTGCSLHWLLTGEGPPKVPLSVVGSSEPPSVASSLTPLIRAEIRKEIIEVLGLLLSERDRAFADSLVEELRTQIIKPAKK